MRGQLRLMLCAIQFLTRLPVPSFQNFEPEWITRSARYFPLVGQLVGLICAGVLFLAAQIWPMAVSVVLALAAGLLITGAFHEDGLADTVDGLGGGQNIAHRLSIMKDSRIGTYGTLALIIMLLLKISVLSQLELTTACIVMIVAAGAGRAAAVGVMYLLPYAGDPGISKSKPTPQGVTLSEVCLALVLGSWPLGFLELDVALYAVLLGSLSVGAVVFVAHRLIGGQTGDVLGACEQVFEVGFFLGVAAVLKGVA